MRSPLTALLAAAVLTSCGGDDGPRAASTAPPAATASSSPAATTSPSGTASASPSATPAAGGTRDERAVRRTLVAFYQAQLDRDGEATCALMTRRAQRFYESGFGGPCTRLFGPDGARLWSVGARFSVGAASAARVVVRGDLATTEVLDETQVLRRAGGRWRIDEPVVG